MTARFRLARAGVLNVWQYDDQIFEFADGRLLLRGANGAGKSKTLEMLLPFVLDGDKARMTASGKHHTSLLWLMLDGYTGQNRAGYLWVELARDGETFTCGVGIRASQSTRDARTWYFTFPGRIGTDLALEDDAGPLARERLRAAVEAGGGHFFDAPRAYKQHVGLTLFGLDPTRYDDLLRLLYWLRQPQVGEDIEPARLAGQLVQALPALDDDAVRAAGDTFDELAAFGEQLDRQRRSADGVAAFAGVYAGYARQVLRDRGARLVEHHTERGRRSREVERREAEVERIAAERAAVERERDEVAAERGTLGARLRTLYRDPLLDTERELSAAQDRAGERAAAADTAEAAAARARRRAEHSRERARTDAARLVADVTGLVTAAHGHAAELGRCGAGTGLPVASALHDPVLSAAADAAAALDGLDGHVTAVAQARPALGERRAAVEVVAEARHALDRASTAREHAEHRAAEAEARAEEERGHRADAERAAGRAEAAFTAVLDAWRADERAVPFDPPEAPTADAIGGLAAAARAAADPVRRARRDEEKRAGAARAAAEQEIDAARARRDRVAAERDPAPPQPPWGRDPRDAADGGPFWRLVDFAGHLDHDARAGLEAALESSGLLDAWVRRDGTVLDADRRDTALPLGPAAAPGPTLASVLVADPPTDTGMPATVIEGVLSRVALAPAALATPAHDAGALAGTDGRWRLGPLTGRATKPAAQYVGANARAGERARRLAEIDDRVAVLEEAREEAAAAERIAGAAAAAVETWLAELPTAQPLLQAWAELDARIRTETRADRHAAEVEGAAVLARSAETSRRRALEDLAATHGLPTDTDALAARREALRTLDAELGRHADAATVLASRVRRWAEDATSAETDLGEAEQLAATAGVTRAGALAARAAADELEQTAGVPVRELRRRIADTESRDGALASRQAELADHLAALLGDGGAARQAATDAAQRLAEHEPALGDTVSAFAATADTPGLLDSGLADDPTEHRPEVQVALDLARGFTAGQPVPAAVLGLARRFAQLDPPASGGTETAVYAAWQDATNSPAGDVEPRVAEIGGALAAIGRHDTGEHPVGALAVQLAAAVTRDAELLTERERRLFEEHILGDLGESLRARRLESDELVTEMNTLLRGVTTSQGIAVQLRWTLRDDVAADARRAVELLGRPVGALLPEERRELRDALHRLIEASRADAPEDSYSEHLARALDYRRWFAFRVRYTRPETAGTWHELHRRSPLSQGEQKVVCYLPLFAAAAAHFGSLAGAAPHSPRFVLLDDAFPKIDVRTHPLLFGLLVQLDLDFVITSERLWGDHATVPSLAIYEALRDPAERGIAQYRHTWDGHRLQAVGA